MSVTCVVKWSTFLFCDAHLRTKNSYYTNAYSRRKQFGTHVSRMFAFTDTFQAERE
jgi:hypothetical protein